MGVGCVRNAQIRECKDTHPCARMIHGHGMVCRFPAAPRGSAGKALPHPHPIFSLLKILGVPNLSDFAWIYQHCQGPELHPSHPTRFKTKLPLVETTEQKV